MKLVGILIALVLLAACSDRHSEKHLGHWQSDKARTLLAMDQAKAAGRLTAQAEVNEKLLRDGYFGRLRIDIEPGRSKSWFAGSGESAGDIPWDTFDIQHLEANRYKFVSEDQQAGESRTYEVIFEPGGQCYSVEMPSLGFSEWFCRVRSD